MKREPSSKSQSDSGIDDDRKQQDYTDDDEMELEEDYELDPPRPELNDNHYDNQYSFCDIEIKERKYMVLYKAYKNLPLCLSEPMKYNNIIRSTIFDNTNLIWKLLKHEKMYPILRSLNRYQRYNHFPCTWQLSRKDNLYNNFIKMKKKFPNDYNYLNHLFC